MYTPHFLTLITIKQLPNLNIAIYNKSKEFEYHNNINRYVNNAMTHFKACNYNN